MEPKVIFLDIDGTLTEPGSSEPPRSALLAIEKARNFGHYVFLCSGRNYDMLSPLLQYGFDGFVASSGGYIKCSNEVIYDCPMTEPQRQTAMRVLKENGIYRTVECIDGSYTDEGLKEFLSVHACEGSNSELLRWREQIEKSLRIRPMKEYKGQPVYKIVIMSRSKNLLDLPEKILSQDFVFCMQETDTYGFVNGEIVNKKFDKGKAVKRVCEHLNIPICRSIAFGDSMNDIEMMEAAGLGICMENGSESLKKIADDICPSVSKNGIWEAFLKYQII